ncbi:MAG: hypothetical protein OQL08_00645 [Gammaproteobacteria bacterium]|nr:hypothetical protein [Gammaproteobacteria bacterium]
MANDPDDFLEVKILDSSIPATIFGNWTVEVCEDTGNKGGGDGCTPSPIPLSTFTDTQTPWLVLKDGTIGNYINFFEGFDAILRDAAGNVIDYVSVSGHTELQDTSCAALPYDNDFAAPGASDKFIFRDPDGTGNWDSAQSAAANGTEDSSNNGADLPTLSFADVTMIQGSTTATVNLTLSGTLSNDLIITFYTIDGELTAGDDYTAISAGTQTITISAGTTSGSFDITLAADSDIGDFYFFIAIAATSPGSATLQNHVGTVSVIGQPLAGFSIVPTTLTASTCTPLSVTITALDENGNTLSGYDGAITITTSTGHGNWAASSTINSLAPSPDSDDNGAVSYTFDGTPITGDGGSIVLDLANVHADTALLITVTESANGLTGQSAAINFSDNVFVITPTTATAGIAPSNTMIAGRPHDFDLALWTRDLTTGLCALQTGYNSASQGLKFYLDRQGELTTALDPLIGATAITETVPAADNIQLDFSAGGVASFTLGSSDVGKYTLHVRDEGNSFASGTTVSGSIDLLAIPFAFAIDYVAQRKDDLLDGTLGDVADTSYAADASGTAFIAAGSDFDLSVTAVLWSTADDTDNDGVIDANANPYDNATTPAFGGETTATNLAVSSTLVAPAAGDPGTLTATPLSTADFTSAVASATLSWDEVGILDITIDLNNYLGGTVPVSGTMPNVGRFFPAAFTLDITDHGTFAAGCPTCTTPFTYLGDSFGYEGGDLPTATLSAINGDGNITTNYQGDFAKLATNPGATLALTYPLTDNTTNNADASAKLGVSSTPGAPSLNANGDGTLTLQLGASTMDSFTYDRERVPPFTAALSIALNAVDDGDITTSFTTANLFTPQSAFEQRYGRAVLGNTFGSSVVGTPITIPLTLQYLDATGAFATNSDDTVTTIDAAHLDCIDPNSSDSLACLTVSGTPGNGGVYTLTADGNRGTLYYPLDLAAATGADLEFLRFDWDEDGTEDNPQATVVLGIYPNYHDDGRFRNWMEDK